MCQKELIATCWTLSLWFRTRPFSDDDSNDILKKYYKVLLRTTKYYFGTTPYYKALFRTTLYYKVLLRTIYKVYQSFKSVSPQPASQPRLLFALTTSILYLEVQHFELRLSPDTAPAVKS